MPDRPKMPVPPGELTPHDLSDEIRRWAEEQGYTFASKPHSSENRKIIVHDPAGGFTNTTIPNPHRGKRLRPDQVRYLVQKLNRRWKE